MKTTLPKLQIVTRKGEEVFVSIPPLAPSRGPRFPVAPKPFGEGGCSMKITEDVRKYAAEQGIAEEEALKKGMEEKSIEFTEKGSELYAKT
jgi:hypothetical protein